MNEKLKNKKGITLIALVVTIVIILILAGITVEMVTSDNGILKETKNAKIQAEIDNEKSIVERAKMLTMMREKSGKVTFAVFEPALKDEAGTNPTEVSDAGDTIEVLFTDSNRYYEVDKDGNVSEPQEIVEVEYAGDITKGGRCDGSEEKPYEISCIEDLVAFSNMSNGTGIRFKDGSAVEITSENIFQNKYVILTRNLNFKSKYSYEDSTRTDFGNLNNNDSDGNSLIVEMTTGTGWIPIGEKTFFDGKFDGKEHTISNLYINALEEDKKDKALFKSIRENASIINLTVTGKIKSNGQAAGIVSIGITGKNTGEIINCTNKVDVIGYNMVGGIAGSYIAKIENCKNYGDLEITGSGYSYSGAGGIVGVANNSNTEVIIKNCTNCGKIQGGSLVGGITSNSTGPTNIINCLNNGNIISKESSAGGIIAWQRGGKLEILNSANSGIIEGKKKSGGIIGNVGGAAWTAILNTYIYNSYNVGQIISDTVSGGIVGVKDTLSAQNYLYIGNSYNIGKIIGNEYGNAIGKIYSQTDTKIECTNVYYTLEPAIGTGSLTSGEATLKSESEIKSQTFVDLLNSNIGTNAEWNKWILGNDDYPIFDR